MELKLSRISHDTVSKETVVTFADLFEPHPQVTVLIKVMSLPDHTEAQIETLVKSNTRDVLEAAAKRCV